jgi:hypothetical protein
MELSSFFGVVSTVDFALLGLWWVAVQASPDLRRRGAGGGRMAYIVSLQFVVPGTASLLAQVSPSLTIIWRISFAVAGVSGILAIILMVPALAAVGEVTVSRFLRIGGLPLYALMTIIAVIPDFLSNDKVNALNVEAILFCLVIFLGAQVAWAAAMPPDLEADAVEPDPATRTQV